MTTATATDQTIAKTIVQQLYAMDANAMMCMGATRFCASSDGVTFKVSGLKHKGYVDVKLNGMDLYNVKFISKKFVIKKEIKDIYAEDLANILYSFVEKGIGIEEVLYWGK